MWLPRVVSTSSTTDPGAVSTTDVSTRSATALGADQAGPRVRLQGLAHRGHVVRVEQVALDVAVEPLPGGVLLGGLCAGHRVGGEVELAALGGAVPDLHEP